MLDNISNQPIKLRTKNWIETNDDARGTYNTNNQFKFKTSMLKTSLSIIVMHIYLSKGLYQSAENKFHRRHLIMVKKLYLKIVLILLIT